MTQHDDTPLAAPPVWAHLNTLAIPAERARPADQHGAVVRQVDAMLRLGAYLLPVEPGSKKPVYRHCFDIAPLDRDTAIAWVMRGGNLGINLTRSGTNGWITFDADNPAALAALTAAGYRLAVVTAKGHIPGGPKQGCGHVIMTVPDHIDPTALHTGPSVRLANGGVLDVLVGRRQAIAPLSRLDEAEGYEYVAQPGTALHPDTIHTPLPVAPLYPFDPTASAPPGLEPMAGSALAPVRQPRPDDGTSDELSDLVDGTPWNDWIDGDTRLIDTGTIDACGCSIHHWTGSENEKSATMHEGCWYGNGIHIFSGTMQHDLGLNEHVSRLTFAAALHDISLAEAAARVGIDLAEGRIKLTAITHETLREYALQLRAEADAAADTTLREQLDARAGRCSKWADAMEQSWLKWKEKAEAEEAFAERFAATVATGEPQPRIAGGFPSALGSEPADDTDPIAQAAAEWEDERIRHASDLHPYLRRLSAGAQMEEVNALMSMALSDRDDAKAAAMSGTLTRLGLSLTELTGDRSGYAWRRLREGAAGVWDADTDLAPIDERTLDMLLNAEPPEPVHGHGLFYAQGLHVLAGPGGCGKTWIALAACAAALQPVPIGKRRIEAIYLDLDQNMQLLQRLRDLGVSRNQLMRKEVATKNVGQLAAERREGVIATLRSIVAALSEMPMPPQIVIVDSLTRVMAESGDSSNDGDGITRALGIFNRLAEQSCVVVLDHVGHENSDRPAGSVAKINASRVVLTLEPSKSNPDNYPDTITTAHVLITKDRDGGLRKWLAAGEREPRPRVGLVAVNRDDETGKTTVQFIPERDTDAAAKRRASEEGQKRAERITAVALQVATEAAAGAITTEEAKQRGCEARAPLSKDQLVKEVQARLGDDKDVRRSDVRHAVNDMTERGLLVAATGSWGRGKRWVPRATGEDATDD